MKNKARVVKSVFEILSLLAIAGFVFFVWKTMPGHYKDLYEYIKFFINERIWDIKKVIAYGAASLAIILGVIWILRNIVKGRKLHSLTGPILLNLFVLFGLVLFRDRRFMLAISDPVDKDALRQAIIFTSLAAATMVFLLVALIAAIADKPRKADKPKKIKSAVVKKEIEEEVKEEIVKETICCTETSKANEHECACCCDVRKEIEEIRKLILEVRELVNEKGLQGRKVLVKKLVTEEVVSEEIEKEKIVSPIPAKEEPVAVLIKESDVISPVDVEEPIDIETKSTTRFVSQDGLSSKKIIRKPFNEKMASADEVNKANYNLIKNELMSYGVKSRISHSGDTFRLKRETYAKLSLVGKNLKIYLALNPAEYSDTTIPAKDVSAKKCFEEVPTMLQVRSRLSIKRAKLLIEELMKTKGLERKEAKEADFASEFVAPKQKKAKKA